jgi:hypothetical protein
MSSVAFPSEAARARANGRLASLLAERGYAVVLGAPLALLAAVLLLELPQSINVDSWLALVTGRLVWDHGLPHHETLTAISHGIVWVDQQWLSQLGSYALYRAGGLALLGLVNVALLVSGLAVATIGARRLGAPFRSALILLPLCTLLVTPSREVRTQEFAIPLFAVLVYLLARDSRQPSRRVFWTLPILLLWANLHGTVTLGAMLVALHGAVAGFERRRELLRTARAWLRPLTLILGAAVAILITPYGTSIIGYYRSTMVSGELRHVVTEWQPVTTSTTESVVLFLVLGLALWSFGRHPEKTTTWENLALLIVAASAIEVIRNALFLGVLAMLVVPVSLAWGKDVARPAGNPRAVLINGLLAATAAALLAIAVIGNFTRPASQFEFGSQRAGVLAAVQTAVRQDPSLRIMADEHFGDWLLWRDPALSGRIGNDVRFEILTATQLSRLEAFFQELGPNWKRAARGYRLLVLDRQDDPGTYTTMRHEPGAQILYSDGQREVILRSPAGAEQS